MTMEKEIEMKNEDIDTKINMIVDDILYLINKHELKNFNELKKYLYTHNLDEEQILRMKDIYRLYGENNVLNCIFFYKASGIKNRENLIQKIKGVI